MKTSKSNSANTGPEKRLFNSAYVSAFFVSRIAAARALSLSAKSQSRSTWTPLFLAVFVLAAADVAAEIPRSAEGKPDFSGIWQTLSTANDSLEAHSARKGAPPGPGVVEGGVIPYKPGAIDQREKNFVERATADPAHKCFSLGTPRAVYYPEPFQIFQRGRDLTLLFQFSHRARTIHTNDSLHPEGPIGFWFGDSRAKWEGDTLVVDVVDFTADTWLDNAGNYHSEQLHVTERWQLLDENTLEYSATLEDPEVYTQPWNISVLLYRHREPNFQLIENTCYTLDYDQYYPVPIIDQATPSS
jgi:hypothetical protein